MGNNIIKGLILSIGIIACSSTALATDKVSSPYITKGKMVLEYRGGYDIDDSNSKDEKQSNKLVANYGITDRLRPEIKLVISNNPNADPRVTGIEAGLRWQFLKPEEAWLSAALDGNFKPSTDSGKSDKFELKLLLGKKIGKFAHVANISLEEEVGEHSRDGATLKAAWKSNYKVNKHFAPGVEFFANTGKLRDDLDYNQQKYSLGPAASGEIVDGIKYNVGYLFGISEAATDGRVKLILSYVKKF